MKLEANLKSTKGVVVKLWDIKNNKSQDGKADITASIAYIKDDEKTSVEADLFDEDLKNSITYATNDLKTMHQALVGGYLINDIENAAQEMIDVKNIFGKTNGRTAIHGVISLDVDESNVSNAGKLISMARDVLSEIFPNHQFIYAVHTNTENLHIHFIVNSVGMDGHKIHRDNRFIQDVLQPTVNDKAIKYGFSPNTKWIEKRGLDKLSFPERKALLRRDIDETIEKSNEFDDFCMIMRDKGYTVNVGKHISLQDLNMDKAIRTNQLGQRYTIEAITERIANRLLEFNYLSAANHTSSVLLEESFFRYSKMPKYKDLSSAEKREVIKLLKQGRNPWQEHYVKSWQYQKINRQIVLASNAIKLVKAYSPNMNVSVAMEEIIKRQREITEEKRRIRQNMKDYKPVTDLYVQMQKLQAKAYLYEFCDSSEYANEYAEYMDYVKRLKEGYNKIPDEVYEFLVDQRQQLLYLDAQRKELNDEYKTIKKYLLNDINRAQQLGIAMNLAEISNFHDEVVVADKTGITVADTKYIATKDSEYIIRMTKAAYLDNNGKPKQDIEFVVLDEYGTIHDKAILTEMEGIKAFSRRVDEITKLYGFTDCVIQNDFKSAQRISGANVNRVKSVETKENNGNRKAR